MQRYFHERGRNHMEALEKIQRKYGDNFRILTQKNVPAPGIMGLFGREVVEYSGYILAGKEALRDQQDRDTKNKAAILAAAGKNVNEPPQAPAGMSIPNESIVAKSGDLDEILQEIRSIKGRLAISASPPPAEPFPHIAELENILRNNDFSQSCITEITQHIRSQFTAIELEDRSKVHHAVATIMAEKIHCIPSLGSSMPKVFVLVGPTGVGKTTTIAKLAAVHGLSSQKRNVRIITVDSFRIGARAQLETYGEIMGIPVTAVDSYDQLKTQIALSADADLVLVDTIGKSPRDGERIEEMRNLLSACQPQSEVHLAVSATTKLADLADIFEQFETFEYQAVVITKLDETSRIGHLLDILMQTGTAISYITDGQSVPVDIALASPQRLLGRLKGLEFDASAVGNDQHTLDLMEAWR